MQFPGDSKKQHQQQNSEEHPTLNNRDNIHTHAASITNIQIIFTVCTMVMGVVGWCKGAVYLTSLGRPTDIGLQLGKACYPCSG